MARPVIIVNFKTYRQATGHAAETLATQCAAAAKKHGADIRVATQMTDIYRVSQQSNLPVYAQHNDPTEPGQNTGHATPLAIKSSGAMGAFLSHSEHPMRSEDIIVAVKLLQKEKLETIVFVPSVKKLELLQKHIRPTYFCYEPPTLVGGDVSVSMAHPDLMKHAVAASAVPILVGAGVKTHDDLQIALDLGARGVVLASGIVLTHHRALAFKKLLTQHGR